MVVERPYRRSFKAVILGSLMIAFALALYALAFLTLAGSEIAMRTLSSLIGLVLASTLAYLGYLLLKTRLPKPAEEFQREYEEVLRKVKEVVDEYYKKGGQ